MGRASSLPHPAVWVRPGAHAGSPGHFLRPLANGAIVVCLAWVTAAGCDRHLPLFPF